MKVSEAIKLKLPFWVKESFELGDQTLLCVEINDEHPKYDFRFLALYGERACLVYEPGFLPSSVYRKNEEIEVVSPDPAMFKKLILAVFK